MYTIFNHLKRGKQTNELYHSHSLGGFSAGLLVAGNGAADVGEDTSFGNDGVVEELVEFLVVADGEQNVSGDNSGLLVVLGGVAGQLEHLSGEVLEDGGEVHGGTGTDSLGVVGVSEESADSADGELESCSAGLGHSLVGSSLSLSGFSTFSCHCSYFDYKKERFNFRFASNFICYSEMQPIRLFGQPTIKLDQFGMNVVFQMVFFCEIVGDLKSLEMGEAAWLQLGIVIIMDNSQEGSWKTETKRHVEKMQLVFQDTIYHEERFMLKFFPWIRTSELKRTLIKERFNLPHRYLTEHDIRLFYKNIELTHQNKNFFDFYKIEPGSIIIIMKNYKNKFENGVINPYQIFEEVPPEIRDLIINVQSGLNVARKPRLADEGTSGTYFLESNQKNVVVAVYKPYDEQPYTPNNPRGYVGDLSSSGIRKGILSGQSATREVAAFLLDSKYHFHEVPATTYVEFYHPCFSYKQVCENNPIISTKQCDLNKQNTKHGSLQQFVECYDVVGNVSSRQFDTEEVHKIAILDLRILNCDRNEANILVVKKLVSSQGVTAKVTKLIPIDHGLSFPDNFQIYDHQIVWMTYKQAQKPLSLESLKYIDNIDPIKDCQTLREKLGFRQICLRNFIIAETFLKKMAKAGFTLFQIGTFAFRVEESDQQQPNIQIKNLNLSELEKLVKEAEIIYFTVRDNGIKSTVEFQIGLIKQRQEEHAKDDIDTKENSIQEGKLELGSHTKRNSRPMETSIEKPRNVSLPNLKKNPPKDIKNRILRFKKKKTNAKKDENAKEKHEKWSDVFFHYFEEILDRFIKRKLEIRRKHLSTGRDRLFSENIGL